VNSLGAGDDYIKKCKWCQNDIKMHYDNKTGWKAYDIGGKLHNCRKTSQTESKKDGASYIPSTTGSDRLALIDSIVDDMERIKKIMDSVESRIREL
tara:strand:- start:62 stop:349 length:288 start_codon:yes stop_codon:yes gene_type:complete